MPRIKPKANAVTMSDIRETNDQFGDSIETNRPQAEEKDLQDLLKDIEDQYEEEEVKRKKNRKKKNKKEDVLDEDHQPEDIVEVKIAKRSMKRLKLAAVKQEDTKENAMKKNDTKSDTIQKNQALVDFQEVTSQSSKEHLDTKTVPVNQPPVLSNKTTVSAALNQQKKLSSGSAKVNAVSIGKKGKADTKAKNIEILKQALARQKEIEAQLDREEEESFQREEELDRIKELKRREEQLRKQKRKEKDKARILKKKELGTYLTKEQKDKKDRALLQLKLAGVLPIVDDNSTQKEQFSKSKRTNKVSKVKKDTAEVVVEKVVEPQVIETIIDSDDDVKKCWDDDTSDEEVKVSEIVPKVIQHESNENNDSESSDSTSDDESDEEDIRSLPPGERAVARIKRRKYLAEQRIDPNDLRCPVICVMGHVDTGKTKMLDNLRRTHVQDGEAGGITQQIGSTNVPQVTILERTKHCAKEEIKLPGFIFIDTPGHESFKNLRVRGSSLCDIAILIVDLMHGIEPQTIESLFLLRSRRCPFIIALNKIDRLNGWKSNPNIPVAELIENHQDIHTQNDFERRYKQVIVELAQQKINAALFHKNPDPKSFYPMVPVSAVSGDGVGDLMYAIVEVCQNALSSKIAFSEDLKCTVMEVKSIEGFGTTIDICLVNGRLRVGDTIVVPGQEGPIVTQIRGLMMPANNKDFRVKNQYQIYKEVKGTRGVKIAAKGLDRSMAGLPLYVAKKDDEIEIYQEDLRCQLKGVLGSFATQDVGVYVQASTLGALEALLAFLNTSKIPFSGLNIGPVHRLDVTRASVMLEKDSKWAVILAFDVRIEREAQEMADNCGVKIFSADIIYHLFDKFMAYRDELKAQNKEKHKHAAIFPTIIEILPQFIFNSRDPIVVGVKVSKGCLKIGTPLCVIHEDVDLPIDVGRVSSIELNHKSIDSARSGEEVCIKIESIPGEAPKMIGRHFEITDPLLSKITRDSIDIMKEHFRDDMQKADWQLIIELKNKLRII